MTWNSQGDCVVDGDLVEMVGSKHKSFLIRAAEGEEFQTHRGVIKHSEIIGKEWGTRIVTHLGKPFFILQPSLASILKELPRTTQILYPKEIGYALVAMGIGQGQRVIEAGTGSGSMTCALAFAVGDEGKVFSYELRPDIQALAKKNLSRLGLEHRVEFKVRDIAEGFDETNVDAFFLDVQSPCDYMEQVRAALKPGGFFGSIIPTMNQVTRLLTALRQNDFAFIDICEILMRFYKAETERFRPVDRMIAHTGFLLFARKVQIQTDEDMKFLYEVDGSQPHVLRQQNKTQVNEEDEI
ncbi:MAG TPA: tRNA (adenine-N1)-methyltransferase [Bellilinea sp.]|nr:tRNA (adenine-N1)-methyltransferase [Bellilinea sp.]